MNRLFYLLILVTLSLIILGCDNTDSTQNNSNITEYLAQLMSLHNKISEFNISYSMNISYKIYKVKIIDQHLNYFRSENFTVLDNLPNNYDSYGWSEYNHPSYSILCAGARTNIESCKFIDRREIWIDKIAARALYNYGQSLHNISEIKKEGKLSILNKECNIYHYTGHSYAYDYEKDPNGYNFSTDNFGLFERDYIYCIDDKSGLVLAFNYRDENANYSFIATNISFEKVSVSFPTNAIIEVAGYWNNTVYGTIVKLSEFTNLSLNLAIASYLTNSAPFVHTYSAKLYEKTNFGLRIPSDFKQSITGSINVCSSPTYCGTNHKTIWGEDECSQYTGNPSLCTPEKDCEYSASGICTYTECSTFTEDKCSRTTKCIYGEINYGNFHQNGCKIKTCYDYTIDTCPGKCLLSSSSPIYDESETRTCDEYFCMMTSDINKCTANNKCEWRSTYSDCVSKDSKHKSNYKVTITQVSAN